MPNPFPSCEKKFDTIKQNGIYESNTVDDKIFSRLLREEHWVLIIVDKWSFIAVHPEIKIDNIKLPR